jgi:hypothetical protein
MSSFDKRLSSYEIFCDMSPRGLDFLCFAKYSIATHHEQKRGASEKATMSEVWNTKYGPRRVRFDPPTLKEAIFAARGLTDELQQQAEIAAATRDLLNTLATITGKGGAATSSAALSAFAGFAPASSRASLKAPNCNATSISFQFK